MSLYEQRVSPIREKLLANVEGIRGALEQYIDSDRYVALNDQDHAININQEEVLALLKYEAGAKEAIAEMEKYFKIYPYKDDIEEDVRLCCGTTIFLDQLNLAGNLKVGKIEKEE